MRLLVVAALALALGAAPAAAQPTSPTPEPTVTPSPTPTPKPRLVNTVYPGLKGTPRMEQALVATSGTWSPQPSHLNFRWFRDGKMITGQTRTFYRLQPQDVGRTIQVRVYGIRPGYVSTARSSKAVKVDHVTAQRRVVTYSVVTRGKITTSVSEFKRLAQQTYDDPRGWRSNGIRFKRVSKGGDFTLVLAQAGTVPSYSSACSSQWSCRVGRHVIINQDRWKKASPAWKKAKGSVRDYRHMVVNHETGHWLGKGHVSCSKKGSAARVMQQQSKSLGGCRFNAWPTKGERYAPRFKF